MSAVTIVAVAAADFRIRFRRTSTLVIFTLLSVFPLFWIQNLSTGRTVMQIGGKRVLYNSAAIGTATALLGMLAIGLAGYYVVSSAIRRDAVTRCGFVLAATPMRSIDYLAGKFIGNVIFLATFVSGFMTTSMVMQIVRGEVPLEPLVFVQQYLLLTPPVIVFVSVLAILFESVPFLAGRLGDVAYFFAWVLMGNLLTEAMSHRNAHWLKFLDVTGVGFISDQLKEGGRGSVVIGLHDFNPANGIAIFRGLSGDGAHLFERLGSTLAPLPLLLIALWSFHRFDPVRVKHTGPRKGSGWVARLNRWSSPVARPLLGLLRPGHGLAATVRADVWLTFATQPVLAVAVLSIALFSLVTPARQVAQEVLPLAFLCAGIAVSDIAAREQRCATTSLVYAAPDLRELLIVWKGLTTVAVMGSFVFIPILLMTIAGQQILAAVSGTLFVAAAAIFFGAISRNPKTFLFLFLSLWYLTVSDKGATPAIDFAGFYQHPAVIFPLAYAAAAFVLLTAAAAWHRRRLAVS